MTPETNDKLLSEATVKWHSLKPVYKLPWPPSVHVAACSRLAVGDGDTSARASMVAISPAAADTDTDTATPVAPSSPTTTTNQPSDTKLVRDFLVVFDQLEPSLHAQLSAAQRTRVRRATCAPMSMARLLSTNPDMTVLMIVLGGVMVAVVVDACRTREYRGGRHALPTATAAPSVLARRTVDRLVDRVIMPRRP